jgi:hypothetical protein
VRGLSARPGDLDKPEAIDQRHADLRLAAADTESYWPFGSSCWAFGSPPRGPHRPQVGAPNVLLAAGNVSRRRPPLRGRPSSASHQSARLDPFPFQLRTHSVAAMTDKQELEKQDEEAGDEADRADAEAPLSPKQPDDELDSNFLPRQIDDDQDATWFLTP